ncbi:helix-turn-helix transcriptional regulator [Corticibacterium sp. UT-5YL-CI-8]|nr:helix-turn-helix transcriptional regulator [Tianweitania sp. UT-5YL-CI-8]
MRGLSQETLAAKAGVARVYVSRIERGQANITLDMLDLLAHTLGCKPDALLAPVPDGEAVVDVRVKQRTPRVPK